MQESKSMKLSIVVPVYNEERFIDEVLTRIRSVKFQDGVELEIIAVDDCSRDKTAEHLEAWRDKGVVVKRHEKNGGKGAALHTGFQMATGDVVTVQDSDFEYNPNDLPKLLQLILDGKADAVFGARESFMPGGSHRGLFSGHYFINKFLTVFSNIFSGLKLHDMECCYKMFRKNILDAVTLRENRFGFEPEVTLKVSRLKPRTAEVAISYQSRSYAEGKKINWKDGVSAVRCIIQYGLFRSK